MLDSPAYRRNLEVADRIDAEVRNDPSSPFAGKYVGILDGQVVTVADDLRGVVERLQQTGADPARMFCFQAGRDYGRTQYIWGLL